MERIGFLDRAFYVNESQQRPMHIGALLELAPPRGFRGNLRKHVVEAMLTRPVGAPFNYRLRLGPGEFPLGYDVVKDVDPASRMYFHKLPKPHDRRALLDAACAIHEQRLDRSQLPWELHVFEGLASGHLGLYMKVHHGLIDGVGFIRRFTQVVSESPGRGAARALWEPKAEPQREPERAPDDPVSGLAQRSVAAVAAAAGNLLGAGAMAARMLMRRAGAGGGMTIPFAGTTVALKSKASQHRTLGHCTLDLRRVHHVAKVGGGKVNDVLLTTLDIAVTRYITERGALPEAPLVAIMPVALQTANSAGNQIALLPVPLGSASGSPADKFRDIVRETRQVKNEVRTVPGAVLELYSILTHTSATLIESLGLDRLPMLGNMNISNPYGVPNRVYFNGCPVELAIPLAPIGHHQTLNVIATTYADELHITFTAIREALPDVQRLADYTVAALHSLERDLDATSPSSRGPEKKASGKRVPTKHSTRKK
jgi:diacylglycerol O-acyltransferase / wax synthase